MKLSKFVLLAMLFSIVLGHRASGLEPVRHDQRAFLSRAIYADNRLWVLSDAGELSTLSAEKPAAAPEPLAAPALDLCLLDGRPAVVTCESSECTKWTLQQWTAGTWSKTSEVQAAGDRLVALTCASDNVALLTNRRLVEVSRKDTSPVMLSAELQKGLVASIHNTRDFVFVGINAGEWGGGLRRIDRRSGKVTTIERIDKGHPWGGPLNSNLDPVNGIASIPWKPDCIALAVGLVHFVPHGRIVEVCDQSVETLYSKPLANPPAAEENNLDLSGTVAFFGLASASNALFAVGIDGIYRIESGGRVPVTPLPAFKKFGEVHANFDFQDMVLVLTGINQRRSISGHVPMLVLR